MWTTALTQTKPSYQFEEKYVFAKAKVDLERESGLLGADGMFLYPVGECFFWRPERL